MKINKNTQISLSTKNSCTVHAKLQAYVNLKLSPEEEEQVDDQLDACGAGCYCEEIIEGLQLAKIGEKLSRENPELKTGLDQDLLFERIRPFIVLPEESSKTAKIIPLTRRPIFWVAASILLFLLSWAVLQSLYHTDTEPKIVQPQDTLAPTPDITEKKQPTPQDEKIESPKQKNSKETPPTPNNQPKPSVDMLAFNPNPDLDARTLRSSGDRGQGEVKGIQPKHLQNFTQNLTLEWENGGIEELSIEIVNNQNELIQSFEVSPSETSKVIDLNLWKPGLYYWIILYQGYEPLYTGKFYVKKKD
ncbi:MAG: hypothetical protein NW226_10780 [Microscillaceae bacterium]|nr:hypothetical protein [Microscillaceae bacterium]